MPRSTRALRPRRRTWRTRRTKKRVHDNQGALLRPDRSRRLADRAEGRLRLRGLVKRGLTGVQLVVSDAHAGLKKAIAQVLGCPWQRCSVHFLREALGHARREQQPMLAALLRPLFNSDSAETARALLGDALERLRKPLPRVAALLEDAEEDLLAFHSFPADHWPKLRSTNPLERVNREIGRRTDVVGIFPNDRSLIRLAASIVIEQNDCVSDSVSTVRLGSEAHPRLAA